jgi:hypothetical protein
MRGEVVDNATLISLSVLLCRSLFGVFISKSVACNKTGEHPCGPIGVVVATAPNLPQNPRNLFLLFRIFSFLP